MKPKIEIITQSDGKKFVGIRTLKSLKHPAVEGGMYSVEEARELAAELITAASAANQEAGLCELCGLSYNNTHACGHDATHRSAISR